ncbi:hypothetical protein [Roseisalinus antarcticus]|uniref:Uncharacterized protein n=1 Tax=Roseisalinus antarcticus TaxID=254357 RepID=A0A1Y5RPM8_9RHOB|nr:hypothetical protein [Roseisalinus antarcticus]SLN22139.1 hypothetical protein ROA7023_00615 [Roseisalinus antarcticus]
MFNPDSITGLASNFARAIDQGLVSRTFLLNDPEARLFVAGPDGSDFEKRTFGYKFSYDFGPVLSFGTADFGGPFAGNQYRSTLDIAFSWQKATQALDTYANTNLFEFEERTLLSCSDFSDILGCTGCSAGSYGSSPSRLFDVRGQAPSTDIGGVVPVPAGLPLLSIGLFGIGLLARRRRGRDRHPDGQGTCLCAIREPGQRPPVRLLSCRTPCNRRPCYARHAQTKCDWPGRAPC